MSAGGFSDPRIPRGDPGDREANGIREGIQASRPIIGSGISASSCFGGIAISARRARRVGGASLLPFSLYDASTTEGETTTYKLGVRNGTITADGVLTNGTDPLPNGMTAGGDPAFTEEIGTETVAWLELDIDDTGEAPEITDINIEVGAPEDVPNQSSTKFCIMLGDFAKNTDKKAVVIGSGSTGIGSQIVEGWRNWFVQPKSFSYAASPA